MSELITKESTLIRAELDMQITTAKAYPRNPDNFIDKATKLATMDQETAESCIYALSRKNDKGEQTFIKGESIRLAEICASAWGNIHAATRITGNDGKKITAEGVAWDLENNVKVCKEVKRSIYSERTKRIYSEDMQVVTGNAASSIALRNAILSIVPRALVKRVYESAVKCAIGDQTKLIQKVQALFERFKKLGIQQEKILTYFNKKSANEITVDEVEEMIGIGTAIKEGNLKIEQAFEMETVSTKTDKLNEELKSESQGNDQFLKELGDVE